MLTRRSAIPGAAFAALTAGCPALADDLNLPRENGTRVAPPPVHLGVRLVSDGRSLSSIVARIRMIVNGSVAWL